MAVLSHVGTCAIWRDRTRVGRIEAEEVDGEGYCCICAVRLSIWLFRTPDVLECQQQYKEPRAILLYVLNPKDPKTAPGIWPDTPRRLLPFIVARLCAPDAVVTAQPHVGVGRNGFVAERFVGRDVLPNLTGPPFTVARDGSLVFAGQDPVQVERECIVDILSVLEMAENDKHVELPGNEDALRESGMLSNLYQVVEVRRALESAKRNGLVVPTAAGLRITEKRRNWLRSQFDQGRFERKVAPSSPEQKPPFGFAPVTRSTAH